MTAFNIHAKGPVGFLATDTALLDDDGAIAFFAKKVRELPAQRMALSCRGPWSSLNLLAREIECGFENFDQLLTIAPKFLRGFVDEYSELLMLDFHGGLDIGLLGYSTARRAVRAVTFSTQDARPIGGVAPFEMCEMEAFFFPAPDAAHLAVAGILRNGRLTLAGEPLVHKVMELQRCMPVELRNIPGNHRFIVGGEMMMTRVSVAGVSTKAVHRWEGDRVGDYITVPIARRVTAGPPVSPRAPLLSESDTLL